MKKIKISKMKDIGINIDVLNTGIDKFFGRTSYRKKRAKRIFKKEDAYISR